MVPGGLNNNSKQAQAQGSQDFYDYLWSRLSEEGEAENAVQDGLTYRKEALRSDTSQHPENSDIVGAPVSSPASQPPVEGVCQAVPDGPRKLLKLLQDIARELLPSRELRRKVALVSLHVPLELLAFHLGVSRQTVYTWVKKLKEENLLDNSPFVVRLNNDRLVRSGSLFAIPLRRVSKVKLGREDFEEVNDRAHVQDIEDGRLSYSWKKAKERGLRPSFDVLVAWAKGQRVLPGQKPDVDLNLIGLLKEMQEDPELKKKLPATITLLAEKLVKIFDDYKSRRFYALVLWKVSRGEISAQFLLGLLNRLLEAYQAGEISRPGAVLVHSLKKYGVPLDP